MIRWLATGTLRTPQTRCALLDLPRAVPCVASGRVCLSVQVSGCPGVQVSGCPGVQVSGCPGVQVSGSGCSSLESIVYTHTYMCIYKQGQAALESRSATGAFSTLYTPVHDMPGHPSHKSLLCVLFTIYIYIYPYGSGLGLSRCLGPGECLHSFIYPLR